MIDFDIFGGKTYQSLLEDIYQSTTGRASLILAMINELRDLVETPEDAILIIPVIVQYIEAGIKNDRHLVELSNTIEKYKRSIDRVSYDSTESSLNPEEMKYLEEQALKSLEEELRGLQRPDIDIED